MDREFVKRESEIQAYLGLIKLKKRRGDNTNDGCKYRKSPLQVKILSEVFRLTGYPSTQTKLDLSLLIDLPIQTVQVWFQNERRSRRRKLRKEGKSIPQEDEELFEISILTLVDIIKDCRKSLGLYRSNNMFF
ncbi:Homeobox protein HD-8 [Nosema bombycis CQ1]|uniref:Homeobox protein HD-8 n=1 Tax=Nosema bombycis (strain CQ1 / CVCC 102059) TaxID=578461 RepID=R0KV92_NOSB1|nr:Homeobox protein HD-8 [Nosema bombycis CQ1]|eukprot:EOB14142.1 Homeobox protein HD-8 [Nosema bombycis CQ1]